MTDTQNMLPEEAAFREWFERQTDAAIWRHAYCAHEAFEAGYRAALAAAPSAVPVDDSEFRQGYAAGHSRGHAAGMLAAAPAAPQQDAPRAALPEALTPMLLLNAAFCIENWDGDVSAEKRAAIVEKLGQCAKQLSKLTEEAPSGAQEATK